MQNTHLRSKLRSKSRPARKPKLEKWSLPTSSYDDSDHSRVPYFSLRAAPALAIVNKTFAMARVRALRRSSLKFHVSSFESIVLCVRWRPLLKNAVLPQMRSVQNTHLRSKLQGKPRPARNLKPGQSTAVAKFLSPGDSYYSRDLGDLASNSIRLNILFT